MELYLNLNNEWIKMDVGQDEDIVFNNTFSALENPTLYVSEYAYSIQLPKSDNNNKILNHINLLDCYDTGFRNAFEYIVICNGNSVSRGRAYIESIDKDSYTLQLSGSLYDCFNKLRNANWNDGDYKMREPWGTLKLTPNIVKSSFDNDSPVWDITQVTNFPALRFPHYAGFMPSNGVKMEGFDTSKWVDNSSIVDICGDNLTPQQVAEFRVSRLRPYLYIDKLFGLYASECTAITGYQMILDDRWYNDKNTYLKNVIYTLPMLQTYDGSQANQYVSYTSVSTNKDENYTKFINLRHNIVSSHTVTATLPNKASFEYSIPMTLRFNGTQLHEWSKTYNTCLDGSFYITVNVRVKNSTETYMTKKIGYMITPGYLNADNSYIMTSPNIQTYRKLEELGCTQIELLRRIPEVTTDGRYTYVNAGDIYQQITLPSSVTTVEDAHIELDIAFGRYNGTYANNFISDDCPVSRLVVNEEDGGAAYYPYPADLVRTLFYEADIIVNTLLDQTNSLNSKLSMARLTKGLVPFDILLKYSKLMGLLWVVNDYHKTITVVDRSDYFYDCFNDGIIPKSDAVSGFLDLSDKIDISNMSVMPLSWQSRRVVLNYGIGDSDYAKRYHDTYGVSYGSVVVNTDTDINNDTEELLQSTDTDTFIAPIFSAEYIRPYRSYASNRVYKVEDDTYFVDEDNTFMFRVGNGTYRTDSRAEWRVTDGSAYVLLSEDSDKEITEGTYCYHKNAIGNDLTTTVRPVFSDSRNGYSLYYAEPYEVYADSKIGKGLFERKFKTYFTEVYNPKNKTVEVDCYIDNEEYVRLKLNPFVVIGNVGYLVLQIDGFDGRVARLTMRQINNYKALYKSSSNIIIGAVGGIDRPSMDVIRPLT